MMMLNGYERPQAGPWNPREGDQASVASITETLKMSFTPLSPALWEMGEGHRVRLKTDAVRTGGEYTTLEVEVPAGWGVAPHVHRNEDQIFYISSGTFWAMVGQELHTVREGDTLFIPRGTIHALRQLGETGGRFIKVVTPAGLEQIYPTLSEIARRVDLPETVRGAHRVLLGAEFGVEYPR